MQSHTIQQRPSGLYSLTRPHKVTHRYNHKPSPDTHRCTDTPRIFHNPSHTHNYTLAQTHAKLSTVTQKIPLHTHTHPTLHNTMAYRDTMTQSPPQSFRGAKSHSHRHTFSDTHRHIHTESQTDSPPLPPAREGDRFSTLPPSHCVWALPPGTPALAWRPVPSSSPRNSLPPFCLPPPAGSVPSQSLLQLPPAFLSRDARTLGLGLQPGTP